MKPFLEKLAEELLGKYGDNISRISVVFPSRRAGIFFKKHLAEQIKKPVWSPAVLGIQDFIIKFSPYTIADKLTLVFQLYEVYKKHSTDETFDKFYPWGNMLLGDFDEIDKSLVEADYLFRILHEHKEIEKDFELKVSDIEEFYKFWQSFSNRELSATQKEFIKIWEIMGKVYHSFRKTLLEKNICYDGMAYRRIYEIIRTKELNIEYDKVIFAGFNLLTKAEEGIIKELIKQNKAETYWDTDDYYLNNELQEAGHFLRNNISSLKIENLNWVESDLKHDSKNIKIIGAPLHISQAKVLGSELTDLKSAQIDKTAVVLPEEGLMVPVLHSIPDNIDSLNITMGFPLRNSSLYALIQLLRNLQNSKKGKGESAVYYHKDVIQILQHPYIKFLAAEEIHELLQNINKNNIVYISRKKILDHFKQAPEIVSEIFNNIDTARKSLDYLYKIITLISRYFESGKNKSVFETEYLFKAYTELNHLNDIITKYSAEIDIKTFWKLFIEVLKLVKVPLTGEPLKGMQVMGLLETRLLDFENVYILSMNEGIMPKGNTQSSFIPYNLRKAFKMPTFEDEDATSAYYFYRLLQRAKNICLIYNTEPGELSAGEKSRYIMQIENELVKENPAIKLKDLIFQTDVTLPKRKEITISKSGDIIESLKSKKHFSATALASYINCPLQFYFKTFARLREEESVEEFFTGAGIGTILHKIMNLLYNDYKNKFVDEKIIRELKKKLNDDFDGLWKQACSQITEFREFKEELQGKNLLYQSIIKKLIDKILDNDIAEAPFKIIALEEKITKEIDIKLNGNPHKVKLLGVLDRIEEKDGVLRIIDYKTGAVKNKKQSSKITDEEHISRIFENVDYKENFQQLFYASLYLDTQKNSKLIIGVYPLRKISDGIFWFEEEPISLDKKMIYENKLAEILNKIFDSTTPFKQTEDIERCKYCSYKSICYRD